MAEIRDAFEPEPPPGFRGLQRDLPISCYERHLPHWRQKGATYFVTFRLGDALPPDELKILQDERQRWKSRHPHARSEKDLEEFARISLQREEQCLDKGYGACYFRDPEWAEKMANALLHYQNVRCFVPCLTVMPNHVHVIMKPLLDFELEDTLKLIKGYVARQINLAFGKSGPIWEQESYDRIIRDTAHLQNVIRYIG
ncbi:MAG: transposase, partial [Planctomycetaceae bacterium]